MSSSSERYTDSDATHSCISIGQRVRFHVECVLIPDPSPVSRIPRLVTKSYSVPLWKRRGQEASPISDSELDTKEDDHVVLKVSVPSFAVKLRSPTRSDQPLVPCIVNHEPASPGLTRRPVRHASLPSPRPDLITVPLRPCCANCVASTEDCMKPGVEWEEQFTRAARRRRNSSADSRDNLPTPRRLVDEMPGFDSVIAVDEVDKLCRMTGARLPPVLPVGDACDDDEVLLPSLSRSSRSLEITRPDESTLFPLPRRTHKRPEPPVSHSAPALGAPSPHASRREETPFPYLTLGPGILEEDAFSPLLPPHLLLFPGADDETSDAILSIPQRRHRQTLSSPISPLPASPPYSPADIPSSSMGSPPTRSSSSRRRPHLNLTGPGSFLKASAEILKGVSLSSGAPLSV